MERKNSEKPKKEIEYSLYITDPLNRYLRVEDSSFWNESLPIKRKITASTLDDLNERLEKYKDIEGLKFGEIQID